MGETIDKIAWHKAGIIKKNCPVVSVPQVPEAENVIRARFEELKGSELILIDPKEIINSDHKIGIPGSHQKSNAVLAQKMCQKFIEIQRKRGINIIAKDSDIIKGLSAAKIPARCQKIRVPKYPDIEWFIDGAHTVESLDVQFF